MKRQTMLKYRWVFLAIGFGFLLPISISVGWWPLWKIGHDAFEARQWSQVPAHVRSATLASPHLSKVSIQTDVIYDYEWKQVKYSGQKIGVGVASADNFGSWQRDTYDQLKNAEISGQAITVWVNPLSPSQSVIQREPRLEMLLFHGACALLLSALAAACFVLYAKTAPRRRRLKIFSDS